MPKTVVRDVFGELLETDKQTVKAGGKAAGDVAKQTAKTFLGQGQTGGQRPPAPSAAIDRMESLRQQRQQQQQREQGEEETRKKQIEKLKQMDKDRSRKAYEEIQQQIRHYQKIKAKKKAAKAKEKFLPWTSKKGMGTGEIQRGVSG